MKYFSGIFIIIYCILLAFFFAAVYENNGELYYKNKTEYDLFMIIIKHSKLILDTYFEITFISMLMFFIRIKKMKKEEHYARNNV